MHADQLEDVVVGPPREVDHLVREQADVDDAEQPAAQPSTTGNASRRRVAKYSLAISTVAQSGIATTFSTITSRDLCDPARRSTAERVGTTPTSRLSIINDVEVVDRALKT